MRVLLLSVLSFLSLTLVAATPPTPAELCSKVRLQTDIFVADKTTGRVQGLIASERIRLGAAGRGEVAAANKTYMCKMGRTHSSNSSDMSKPLYITQMLTVEKSGALTLDVAQYEESQRDKKVPNDVDKPIKRETFDVSDMKVVRWLSPTHEKEMIIVRMTPLWGEERGVVDAKLIPISGENMVLYDNKGRVYSDAVSVNAPFVAMTSAEGTLALSFEKFKGAEALGDASGNRIEVMLPEGLMLTLRSDTNFVPMGERYKVYGLFDPKRRTRSHGSLNMESSDDRGKFEKRLGEVL